MANIKRRSQPYRVDWAPAKSVEELNSRLSRLWTDADEMFQILFDDLQIADNAINAVGTIQGPAGPRGDKGEQGDPGEETITTVLINKPMTPVEVSQLGHWSTLANGDSTWPEVIFTSGGDTIAVWVPSF